MDVKKLGAKLLQGYKSSFINVYVINFSGTHSYLHNFIPKAAAKGTVLISFAICHII